MIASLNGKVTSIFGQKAIIDVNGVGYEIVCTERCGVKLEIGKTVGVVIYTDVKQDCIKLYGFEDNLEKQVFLLLTQVKGVGARTSAEIISRVDKVELLRIIAAENLTKLQSIRGIGKKTAERIIVELKDKVKEFALEGGKGEQQEPIAEALEALLSLGFPRKVAERAIEQVKPMKLNDSGKIVKEALKFV